MKFSAIFSSLAAAVAIAVPTDRASSPLNVKLEAVGNSKVKATITNSGAKSYNLFYKGSFLDHQPVNKLRVSNADTRANFTGILVSLARSGLTEAAFYPLKAGQSKEVEFDIAELYDLSNTADYDLSTEGVFAYAEMGSTELASDALPFSSNKLSIHVDSDKALKVHQAFASKMEKRTVLQSTGCTSAQRSALAASYSGCQTLASRAATDAASGSSTQFRRYFSAASASTVAARLRAVATECGSTTSGRTTSYCTDVLGACEAGVIAYTQPARNIIAHCPIFYSQLTASPNSCDGLTRDRAATSLHEVTHAPAVYSPGTNDYAYGTAASTRLSASQALNNADSYALYAADLALRC